LNEISIEELRDLYLASEDFQVIDVREEWEQPRVNEKNILIAPLDELDEFVGQISKDKKVVVICQHGIRSATAIGQLKKQYKFNNLINLEGGIVNW